MIRFSKGTKFSWAVLTVCVGLLPMWFSNDADGAPVVSLISPNAPVVRVPEGTGLLIEAEVSDDNFPGSSGEYAVSWSVLEAPEGGAVTFSPPTGPATVATFNVPGYYRILISGTYDGVSTGTKELAVYAGSDPDDNLIPTDSAVYLSMNEGGRITAMDSRGRQNNGILRNGARWTGPNGGISGTGIILDGIDDNIRFESEGEDEIGAPFKGRTINLWFKADDPLRETKQVLYQEGESSRGFNIYLEAGRLYVGGWSIINEDIERQEIFLSTELADTNWHQVGLILEDDSGGTIKTFKAFLDGKELSNAGENTFVEHYLIWLFSRRYYIGSNGLSSRYHDGVGMGTRDHFAGIVDEFQLWNRALNPDEVEQLFNIAGHIGPELTLSTLDRSAGSVVIPPGMGLFLDGGTPGSSSLVTQWETVMAPKGGEATFSNSTSPSAFATFSTPGYYKLRLTADDGRQKSAIDVDAHVGLDEGSNFSSSRESVYYSMDQGSGGIVRNSADGSRPGILSNPSGWTSQGGGISGTAIQFDGIDDYIEVDTNDTIQYRTEKLSLALWIKPNEISMGTKQVVFQIGDGSGGINIYLDGDLLYFGNWNEGRSSWNTFLPVPITGGRWHHVALVFDYDGSGLPYDGLRAYLNGRQVASGMAPSGIDSRLDRGTLGDYLQGSRFHDEYTNYNLGYAFSGIMDEFHAYQDHALTIDEIGMLYAFGNVGPTVDAGADQLVLLPSSMVQLEGSSTDDGRWASPLTHSWHIIDGPGGDGGPRLLESNGASGQLDNLEGGSYRFALGAYDGQVTTFDELIVTVRHPTQFEQFMRDFPAIAVDERDHDADPDGDQRSNLAEYAMGGAPDVSETHSQLVLRHELVREAGQWYAEFRYPRRRDAVQRGLRYAFEVSDDLSAGSWMDRGYTVLNITPIDEVFLEYRLRMDEPLSSANSRLFGRVRVYLNE